MCNNIYSKEDAIIAMSTKVKGDKTYTLFNSLISAKLSVANGNDDSCISEAIILADSWFCEHGPVGNQIRAGAITWQMIEETHIELDDYNNGLSCAPHRD